MNLRCISLLITLDTWETKEDAVHRQKHPHDFVAVLAVKVFGFNEDNCRAGDVPLNITLKGMPSGNLT